MQIIINVSDFLFALPVKVVEKVAAPEIVTTNTEGTFLGQIRINLMTAEEFFKIRINKNNPKKSLILLTVRQELPIAILADSVYGFVREGDLNCFNRGELLKMYGFEYVSKICLYKNRLLFFVNESSIEKRVTELLWE